MVDFIIVEVLATYNAIFGQPLYTFWIIVSTYHIATSSLFGNNKITIKGKLHQP